MITALAWSPTRPELAVAGYSGLVQLWRADGTPRLARSLTGLQSSTAQPEAIQALTFSPNGQLLAASNSSKPDERGSGALTLADYGNLLASLAIWRASNGTLAVPPLDLETGHGRYRALAFNRDGRLLAVSRPDGSDLVLDTGTGQVRRKLNPLGADDTVSLAFAPNGTPRDRHPGRDCPAVEPDQRRSSRGPRGGGCRSGHQHRVRSRRPALRDHRHADGCRSPTGRSPCS